MKTPVPHILHKKDLNWSQCQKGQTTPHITLQLYLGYLILLTIYQTDKC